MIQNLYCPTQNLVTILTVDPASLHLEIVSLKVVGVSARSIIAYWWHVIIDLFLNCLFDM
jgi:hypothetical protein